MKNKFITQIGTMKKHFLSRFIIVYLMIAGTGFSIRATDAQVSGVNISIQLTNVKLSDFFSEIEKKTDYVFMYKVNINASEKVSVNAVNKGLEEILEETLSPLQLKYHINGRQIMIVREEAKTLEKTAVQEKEQAPGKTVTGKVTDKTGEPLIGVTIRVKGEIGRAHV
jgi:hypothetical protein